MRSSGSATQLVMPILSAGRHRTPKQGACFMEFASYLAGEKWSDHPACTHPVLAALARDVNDLASDATRSTFARLIPRVVGLTSDDPRFTAALAVHAASAALPIASMDRQRALAVGMLCATALDGSTELGAIAAAAFANAPDAEKWARKHLGSTPPRKLSTRTAVAIVHTAAVGIALACVPDADERLGQLLAGAIGLAEQLTTPHVEPAPVEYWLARS